MQVLYLGCPGAIINWLLSRQYNPIYPIYPNSFTQNSFTQIWRKHNHCRAASRRGSLCFAIFGWMNFGWMNWDIWDIWDYIGYLWDYMDIKLNFLQVCPKLSTRTGTFFWVCTFQKKTRNVIPSNFPVVARRDLFSDAQWWKKRWLPKWARFAKKGPEK